MGHKIHLNTLIRYNDDDVIRPLCIKLPQMIMLFKARDNKLLKKYAKTWEKNSNLLSIKFDSEPAYGDNDKYIKTKIKLYGDKINANFQGKKISKENVSYKCLSLRVLEQIKSIILKHF